MGWMFPEGSGNYALPWLRERGSEGRYQGERNRVTASSGREADGLLFSPGQVVDKHGYFLLVLSFFFFFRGLIILGSKHGNSIFILKHEHLWEDLTFLF